jgi:hypothetical protein
LNRAQRFLNLKKCSKIRTKILKIKKTKFKPPPRKSPNKFNVSKLGLQVLLNGKNHTTLVST